MSDNYHIDKKIGLLLWKTSNYWQNSIKRVLSEYSLTFNEFIILETLLFESKKNITQIYLSKSSGVNISVVSTALKTLENKLLIKKNIDIDNRKKIIELTKNAITLTKKISPIIERLEKNFFSKLGSEELNFTNSMKIVLGKKIRIKADKK
tara:strand:+ start:728 stop:1180 length:453 start_codon:yes stop_codon:yes gene_type:complete